MSGDERRPGRTHVMATVDPDSVTVGDKVQAFISGNSRGEEQPIGVVTAIAADVVTFVAEGEYDMFHAPGDDDYFMAYEKPRTFTVPLAAIRYHWPQKG